MSFASYNSRGVIEDLFPEDESSNDDEEFSNKKSKRRIKKDSSARRCPPGLRKIARQVINIIRASQRPMTYKEISELVTERSKSIILRNARKGNCSLSQDSIEVSSKPQDATERGENNIRALENYKRRIYDAWSVLRAA